MSLDDTVTKSLTGSLSLMDDPRDYLVNRVLDGRYMVLERIGRGGMATVYRGQHVLIERQVAIKVLSPKTSGMGNIKKRFYREARVVNRIQHPNVLDVIDLGETEEHLLYLVMDYLTGESVFDHLSRSTFSPIETVEILEQVCRGLGRAHDLGIIHRDLTPSNIFLCDEGGGKRSVRILDFGIAFIKDETRLSMPGTVLGTPHYMAPEYATGKEVVPASDLYSLGALAYEMLCGDPPFDDEDYSAVIVKHVKEAPQPLRDRLPDVPPPLHDVVMRCLEKKPSDRYANAYELHEQLENVGREIGLGRARTLVTGPAGIRADGSGSRPPSQPPAAGGYEMLRSYMEKARERTGPPTSPYGATRVKEIVDQIEHLDATIAETEARLVEVENRVHTTRDRFGKAQSTLEEERGRVGSDLASLEAELAAVRARRLREEEKLVDARRVVQGMEHVLDSGSAAEMTDALASAYEEASILLGRWRETRGAEDEIGEKVEDRRGDLRDINFQLEQLADNRDQSIARLDGTAKGLRMVVAEKLAERERLCAQVVDR